VDILALLGFIHVGRNDSGEATVGLDRDIGAGEECRPVGRISLPDVDDRETVNR
jgi:hypothetical protein